MQRRHALAALSVLPAACALGPQAPPPGRVRAVARGESLSRAVAAADDGDTIELEPGEHRRQTAVVTQRRLTLRGAGAVLHADGAIAEGKALVVVRGGEVRIDGIEFRGARAAAGNGAGIRFEQGRLHLQRCRFFDNEMGLLSGGRPDAELQVDDCDFGQAPRLPGTLKHLFYVGTIGRLQVRGSRFGDGWFGHLIKSRARINLIHCNRIVDGERGEASYEIDLPNGGVAWVVGNRIGQGPRPQNLALLAYGAEGAPHADCRLQVLHNEFGNQADAPAAFVRWWPERLAAGATVHIAHNRFHGAALDGSWGRPEDDNQRLPLDRWPRDEAMPRCEAAPMPAD
ncbi:MAG: hypothetical protein U1F56_03830 [Rubrivivax sp.]